MTAIPASHRLLFALCVALVLFVGVRMAFSQRVLVYDEGPHMEGARSLREVPLDAQWLRGLYGSPGPLHQVAQFGFAPITDLKPPRVRYVSLFFLAATVALLAATLARLRPEVEPLTALLMLGVPFTYVSAGLAITELPPLPFFVGSILLAKEAGTARTRRRELLAAAAAGVLMGIAFSGRQPLIVCAGPIGVWLLLQRRIAAAFVYGAAALPLPLVLIVIWGGLIPPRTANIGEGFSLLHGVLSFAYAGVALLFVNPQLYRHRSVWVIGAILGVLTAAVGLAEYPVARTLAERLLPSGLLAVYPRVAFGLLMVFAAAFTGAYGRELWLRRDDRVRLLLGVAMLLMLLVNMKNTAQFSSRYLVPVLPLLLLTAGPASAGRPADAVRVLAGAALGLASLETYYRL